MRSCRVQVPEARSALDGTTWSLATPFANSYRSVLFSPACFFSRPLAAVGPFLPLQPLQHERSVQRTLTIPSTQPQLYLFLSMAELGAQLPGLPWLPEQGQVGAVASALQVQPADLAQHPKNCIALGNPPEPCSEKNSVSFLCTCKFNCGTILAIIWSIWSSLPGETRITQNLWDFQTKCKTHFLGLRFLY